MVVAPSFDVGVCEEKDGKNNCDDIPSWEDKPVIRVNHTSTGTPIGFLNPDLREGIHHIPHLPGIIESRESYHRRDLQQANLQRVR